MGQRLDLNAVASNAHYVRALYSAKVYARLTLKECSAANLSTDQSAKT
jgi:hypothetical protein